MKKLLITLVVFVYAVAAIFALTLYLTLVKGEGQGEAAAFFLIGPPILVMLLVCALVIANIIGAVISAGRSRPLPFKTVMICKLCLIPFYAANFVVWAFSMMIFHIAIVVMPVIPVIMAYTYFTMMGTSSHLIAKLITVRRAGLITRKQLVLHCIFQFIFVADVIDSIYLTAKRKKIECALPPTAEAGYGDTE